MNKQDILLKTDEGVFSYRVAGILIRDEKYYFSLYPITAKEKLMNLSDHIEKFVFIEN